MAKRKRIYVNPSEVTVDASFFDRKTAVEIPSKNGEDVPAQLSPELPLSTVSAAEEITSNATAADGSSESLGLAKVKSETTSAESKTAELSTMLPWSLHPDDNEDIYSAPPPSASAEGPSRDPEHSSAAAGGSEPQISVNSLKSSRSVERIKEERGSVGNSREASQSNEQDIVILDSESDVVYLTNDSDSDCEILDVTPIRTVGPPPLKKTSAQKVENYKITPDRATPDKTTGDNTPADSAPADNARADRAPNDNTAAEKTSVLLGATHATEVASEQDHPDPEEIETRRRARKEESLRTVVVHVESRIPGTERKAEKSLSLTESFISLKTQFGSDAVLLFEGSKKPWFYTPKHLLRSAASPQSDSSGLSVQIVTESQWTEMVRAVELGEYVPPLSPPAEPQDVAEDSPSGFVITVASKSAELRLMVNPDTTAQLLLNHFRAANNIPATTAMRLVFDGDRLDLDTSIADLEIEEDDRIDVYLG